METEERTTGKWKSISTIVSFWIFGLCNNLGYVVMLSAAHDIMQDFDKGESTSEIEAAKKDFKRECNVVGTGAILLADIIPSILVKLVAPFLPLFIHIRIAIAVLLSAAGFIFVGIKLNKWLIILGVIFTSLSSGLGESSLLSYMVFFKTKNVISTWSSGTGAAGFFGSFAYAGLVAAGFSPSTAMFSMLISPVAMAACFWLLVDHPKIGTEEIHLEEEAPTTGDRHSFVEKLKLIPHLFLIYTIPFALVYLFEYFINQGLFELLYIPKTFIGHHDQYRWYQVLYQTGVWISRSSMNIIKINYLWLLTILQCTNLIILLVEVLLGYIHFLVIIMGIVLFEGLVGGACYVNTYRRIVSEIPPAEREFSMAMNSFSDSVMITLAGFLALPFHTAICKLKSPYS